MKNLIIAISAAIILLGCSSDDGDVQIDQIEAALSTSATAYQNAANNSWIEITEAEYNSLIGQLQNVQSSGATNANYTQALAQSGGSYARQYTIFNTNPNRKVPKGNYLFAFKYLGGSSSTPHEVIGQKVMLSYDAPDFGAFEAGDLPRHEFSSLDHSSHFVYKGDYRIDENQDAFLGIYAAEWIQTWATLENSSFRGSGVTSTPSVAIDNPYMYQALSTSTKQWP